MNEIELKVKLTSRDAKLPEYAHPTDAGMDLRSIEFAVIKGGEWKLIQTGVAIELPEGYEAQVRPRSGNALKHGITVLNTPGTIDACYRGNIGVILMNVGKNDITVEVGDKIAQLVVMPVTHANVIKVDELNDTERGDGGFGSTGK